MRLAQGVVISCLTNEHHNVRKCILLQVFQVLLVLRNRCH
nr:MAG TPA: hypothetical protein [Caudoviricetes sp.]